VFFVLTDPRCLYNGVLCRIRVPYPFQWGAPTFDAGEAFAMMATSFVALVEVWLLLAVTLRCINKCELAPTPFSGPVFLSLLQLIVVELNPTTYEADNFSLI